MGLNDFSGQALLIVCIKMFMAVLEKSSLIILLLVFGAEEAEDPASRG